MIIAWLAGHAAEVLGLAGLQVLLAALATLVGLVVALPVGYAVSRSRIATRIALVLLGLVTALPALAVIVAMPLVTGARLVDPVNLVLALSVLSAAWLTRSVALGLRSVPISVTRSATALGYAPVHRVVAVDLAVAAPAILRGLRVVVVMNVTLVSVAGVIGTGALGRLFGSTTGPGAAAELAPVVVGLVLILVLAVLADGLIALVERGVAPWAAALR